MVGGLAGLFGAVLGSVATGVILRHTAGIVVWTLDLRAIAITMAGAAAAAAAVGVLGSLPLLRPKPFEVLRRQ